LSVFDWRFVVKETILEIVKIGFPLSVIASMFAQGLSIVSTDLLVFSQRPVLMLRSLVVVLLLVPLAALGIVLVLDPERTVAIGMAILVASPAAPMMLVKVSKKGGRLAYMACLHLSLALLAILTVPVTLHLLSLALGFHAEVGVFAVSKVVGMTILVPVCLGILTRYFFPRVAEAIAPWLGKVAGIVLLVLGLFVVTMAYGTLLKMGLWSYLVMAVVVAAAISIGHWLGPQDTEERTTLAMESAARHPGLAMTIAALNFSPEKALPVLIPYLIVFMLVTTVYLQWRKRSVASLMANDAPI
jgi:BASS family bile acid:Na+ symporter